MGSTAAARTGDAEATVRSACPADAAALADLSDQLGYETSEAAAAGRLARLAGREGHAVLVAESGAHGVIGWVHVFAAERLESPPFAELGGLVVAEGRRGAGVGRLLVEAAERWARELGLQRLRVRSNVVREAAHRFYGRLGFEGVKTQAVLEKGLGGVG